MTYYISQTDVKQLLRFDCDKVFSSFAFVNNQGMHVGLPPSAYRPGWSRSDTKIGTVYTQNLGSLLVEELRELHNSDSHSKAPYANEVLLSAKEQWDEHLQGTSKSIPICAITKAMSPWNNVGGRPKARKGIAFKANDWEKT